MLRNHLEKVSSCSVWHILYATLVDQRPPFITMPLSFLDEERALFHAGHYLILLFLTRWMDNQGRYLEMNYVSQHHTSFISLIVDRTVGGLSVLGQLFEGFSMQTWNEYAKPQRMSSRGQRDARELVYLQGNKAIVVFHDSKHNISAPKLTFFFFKKNIIKKKNRTPHFPRPPLCGLISRFRFSCQCGRFVCHCE